MRGHLINFINLQAIIECIGSDGSHSYSCILRSSFLFSSREMFICVYCINRKRGL
ncbi:unnamed protein product [Larinioides sclopetarius]|uniref:Uncharacterized protein n=1 Tax=Larinioides sclopetarius TaxID=280406 RepID=A0AAV2A587_9ARAC